MRRFAGVMAATLAVVALAGCQLAAPPTTPAPTASTPTHTPSSPAPDPTPTPMCTPEAGGEEFPCTQADYDQMKAKDALYAEAEAVYSRFHEERVRISRAGGIAEPTAAILSTSQGAALDSVMESMRGMLDRGIHAKGESPQVSFSRVAGVSREGSVATLLACVDATGWAFYEGDELQSIGTHAENRVYFSRVDQTLKMTYIEGREVDSCG